MRSIRILSRAGRHIRRHAVSLGAGSSLVVFDVATFDGSNLMVLTGGLAAIGYGVYQTVGDLWTDFRQLRHRYTARNLATPRLPQYEQPYDSWNVISNPEGEAVTSPALNQQLLGDKHVEVKRNPKWWKPWGAVEEIRQLIALQLDRDEAKVRLAGDLLGESSAVEIQRTSYSAFLVTNRTALTPYYKRGEGGPVFQYEDAFLVDGLIPTLARGRLANHIGVSVLGVEPGRIVLVRQSDKNHVSQGLLAPSGSGSCGWSDANERDDLVHLAKAGMVRKMTEELGLKKSVVPSISDVRVIGYARLTHLGGKPDFFGVCRLPPIEERIRISEERYALDFYSLDFGPRPTLSSVLERVSTFKKRHDSELSFPLYAALTLLEAWARSDVGAARWLRLQVT